MAKQPDPGLQRLGLGLVVMVCVLPADVPRAMPTQVRTSGMVLVRAGNYRPLYKSKGAPENRFVRAFWMDSLPVDREEYRTFVLTHPSWGKTRIEPLFAEGTYLADWAGNSDPGPQSPQGPVTFVSWFAAKAYCLDQGKRLPTVVEWERASWAVRRGQSEFQDALGPEDLGLNPVLRIAMGGASRPAARGPVFGQVWEWTYDFNSSVVSGRAPRAGEASLFCGDGVRATNARDYAAFLRYAFRSSLRANYAMKNLGFRCARDGS